MNENRDEVCAMIGHLGHRLIWLLDDTQVPAQQRINILFSFHVAISTHGLSLWKQIVYNDMHTQDGQPREYLNAVILSTKDKKTVLELRKSLQPQCLFEEDIWYLYFDGDWSGYREAQKGIKKIAADCSLHIAEA